MNDRDAKRFQRACRKMNNQLGTPGFEAAVAEFWLALSAIRKVESSRAH